jgi:hypothetical protein
MKDFMKKTQPKTPTEIKETIHAKHVFSNEERLELSLELGRTCTQINVLEAEKSAVTKDFGGRIETQEIKRDSLVEKVTSGYEMRPTDCIVVLDPPNRSKDYFREQSDGTRGDFVERREMTQADFQLTIPETT